MIKSILNLGAVLTKTAQQNISGGGLRIPNCPDGTYPSLHPVVGWHCKAIDSDIRG